MQLTPPPTTATTTSVRSIAQQFNNLAAAAHRQQSSPGSRRNNKSQPQSPQQQSPAQQHKHSVRNINRFEAKHVANNSSNSFGSDRATVLKSVSNHSRSDLSDSSAPNVQYATHSISPLQHSIAPGTAVQRRLPSPGSAVNNYPKDTSNDAGNDLCLGQLMISNNRSSPVIRLQPCNSPINQSLVSSESNGNNTAEPNELNLRTEPASPPLDRRLNQFSLLLAESLADSCGQDAGRLIEQEQRCRVQLQRNEQRVAEFMETLRLAGASNNELDKLQLHVEEVEKLSKLFNSLCARLEQVQQLLGRRRKILLQTAGSSGDLSTGLDETNGQRSPSSPDSPSNKERNNSNLALNAEPSVSSVAGNTSSTAVLTAGNSISTNGQIVATNHHNNGGGWRISTSRLRACASTDSLLDQSSAFSSLLSLSSVSLNGNNFGNGYGNGGLSLELLLSKRNKLLDQLEEAADLRASIERRAQQLQKRILCKYEGQSLINGNVSNTIDSNKTRTEEKLKTISAQQLTLSTGVDTLSSKVVNSTSSATTTTSTIVQTDLDDVNLCNASFVLCMQNRHQLLLRQRQLQRAIQALERSRVA